MNLKIDKNVPVPPRGGYKGYDKLYELRDGDSFTVKNQNEYSNVYSACKIRKIKITSRKQNGIIRIWRVT